MRFNDFLLNEDKYYLGQRAGDILTAIQSLSEDAPNMGARLLIRASQGIVNQIRRVLHGRWDDGEEKYLKKLQKVGVAIMRAIDSNEELSEVIAACAQEIETLLQDLEVPINSLGSEESPTEDDEVPPMDVGTQLGA